jgi:hypothetical protein
VAAHWCAVIIARHTGYSSRTAFCTITNPNGAGKPS